MKYNLAMGAGNVYLLYYAKLNGKQIAENPIAVMGMQITQGLECSKARTVYNPGLFEHCQIVTSVNPISTREGIFCPPHYNLPPPRIFRLFFDPATYQKLYSLNFKQRLFIGYLWPAAGLLHRNSDATSENILLHFATAWRRGGRGRHRKLNGRGARGEQNFSLLVRMRAPNFGSSSLSLVCCPYTPAENNNIGAIRNYVDIHFGKNMFLQWIFYHITSRIYHQVALQFQIMTPVGAK